MKQYTSHTWPRKFLVCFLFALPACFLRLGGISHGPVMAAVCFGAAVVVGALLLAWAAETAQMDISASLAIALLALIAMLPEYSVDLYFAYTSGHKPEYTPYALANMTGSNRLLLGLGWPAIALLGALYCAKKPGGWKSHSITMGPEKRYEVTILGVAALYAFFIVWQRHISIYDSAALIALFAFYMWKAAQQEHEEPELAGIPAELATFRPRARRTTVLLLFIFAAGLILLSAEPFAEALVEAGRHLNIDEFILVQWLAPLASESPELIVIAMLAKRCAEASAMGALLSSKINQWTLLVGTLPIARMLGGGTSSIPFDVRQHEEFLLTAAQTAMGFAFLYDLRFSLKEAFILFALFALQFPFPQTDVRLGFSALYIAIAVVVIIVKRRRGRLQLPR
jgi:cation:H+ antiporter